MKKYRSSYAAQRSLRKQIWGKQFGMMIQGGREKSGRSVEEAARRAAMEPECWQAMEMGKVPAWTELRPIAYAIDVPLNAMCSLVYLCSEAWD